MDNQALERIATIFEAKGWQVRREPRPESQAGARPDLLVSRARKSYAVEIKHLRESRADRAIPLLSQAILQASTMAESLGMQPLAVIVVPHLTDAVLRRTLSFAESYAEGTAIGLVAMGGGAHFVGDELDPLNEQFPEESVSYAQYSTKNGTDLFSDLNQWMLKVLLAPEISGGLLSAPRGEYRTSQDLASAANVSAMSASRFARRLREEGLIDTSSRVIHLVRRRELFARWKSALSRSAPEVGMMYLAPGAPRKQVTRAASELHGCVGLFAAADLLQLGHVSGVPPYVYTRRLPPNLKTSAPSLMPANVGEQPDLIVRQATAPEAMFRGAVPIEGALTADILQVFLDASNHPSRGAEQAELLEETVLANVIGRNER